MFIAIDPGRSKCGLAVVQENGAALELQLLTPENLLAQVQECLQRYPDSQILLGNGTDSEAIQQLLAPITSLLLLVDERNTTLEANALYWQNNTASFWQKLLPASWRSIAQPLDAYAAWAIALRFLKSIEKNKNK